MDIQECSENDKKLSLAQELINKGEYNEAQVILDGIDENSGRKFFIQSKIFEKKEWRKEQRRVLEFAVKAEPENAEYRDELEELIKLENKVLTDEDYYARAEARLNEGNLDSAQSALQHVKEESGRKHYIQSKIYKQRRWYNEQRKEIKAAVKAEPDNEEYKKELAELDEFRKSSEYKQYKKERRQQMGFKETLKDACTGGLGEVCCYCLCEGICQVICEGIGNGC